MFKLYFSFCELLSFLKYVKVEALWCGNIPGAIENCYLVLTVVTHQPLLPPHLILEYRIVLGTASIHPVPALKG